MSLEDEPSGELPRSGPSESAGPPPSDRSPLAEPPPTDNSPPLPAGWPPLGDLPQPAPPRDATSRADKRRNQRR
ncbi:hypothetical protein O7635_11735 [Asanoa sp. WMMD1127]|uniref:hypothetical protein n=1 Tax=Asanoa sp. WMMD1127 TaxID=3016107 RepID=UPI002417D175|nr:hypothetical protein [Asanoa sp. WMMD1127]MDG4822521.1 hypothetical protein [Asanoa sp. WMMD1127]